MMSQNRAAHRDRLAARKDFAVNQQAEAGIEQIRALPRARAQRLEDAAPRIGAAGGAPGGPDRDPW